MTLVHDVHAWTITSGYDALTAHILTDPAYQGSWDEMLTRLRQIAKRDFGIGHVTIQLDRTLASCDELHHVDHLYYREDPSRN